MFWVISVYFNIRNTLPKSGTFLLDTLYNYLLCSVSRAVLGWVIYVLKLGGVYGKNFITIFFWPMGLKYISFIKL